MPYYTKDEDFQFFKFFSFFSMKALLLPAPYQLVYRLAI